MKTLTLRKDSSTLKINPHGARIEELILGGQRIFTKVQRGDGKEGSAHPCIPQFGKETITSFDLPQHGSARNEDFESSTSDNEIIVCRDIIEDKYPKGLHISQKHNISQSKYSLLTTVSNNNNQELPVNFAEHFYWHALNDWEDLMINDVKVADIVKQDKAIDLQRENKIEMPGQKAVILKQKGFSVLQLWSYKNPKTGEYDKHYVCIEPVEGDPVKNFFGSEESMLSPHSSRTTEVIISLE